MTDNTNGEFESRILFVDLETTGLDPREETPLEISVILTDGLGGVFGTDTTYTSLIWEDEDELTEPVNRIVDHQIQPVFDMHRLSGLWTDLFAEGAVRKTRWQVEADIITLLLDQGVQPKTLPIAGLSIGSLDRPFLQYHFPKLNAFLSHRNIDISSIRQIAQRVNPELQTKIERLLEDRVDVTHRAYDDTLYAIELYQAYIANFFYTGAC